ncbi:SLBB domain-containing protein [Aestuariibacter halophilus]|uniref:SLBB domain-containing protein n=1 Tax=Fluctibacter halophilus TaxID=226011 RepID=A0ABS8G2J1_9ALTE|nr:SLBB domain-containing protein [Aestuariibacter halophilus]MCC2614802.1 SLBB domain-containing protein [Aestuariibacter halophilus]
MNVIRVLLTVVCALVAFQPIAQTMPTQQQIQQFKRLPKAQQQRIAQQMGIDLSLLDQQGQGQSNEFDNATQVYPRGTQFDEFGNPIEEDEQKARSEEDDELALYGADIFSNEPTGFNHEISMPVPDHYIIGPGDELVIALYGNETDTFTLNVERDGSILLPPLGPIQVGSLSFADATQAIRNAVTQQLIGVKVSVTMGSLRTMRVFVMGEAYKPGAYQVSALSTITNALFASGGVTDIASLRTIKVKRQGKTVVEFDLYDLLNEGDASSDITLQDGDVVFVPALKDTVEVDGQVRRPAIYELKDERHLDEVLALAGNPLPSAYIEAVSIGRFEQGRKIQITADGRQGANTPVFSGDEIKVPSVTKRVSDAVTLIGAVARPGRYQYHQGVTIGTLLGDVSKTVLETADLSYILVLRTNPVNYQMQVFQLDYIDVLSGQADDFPLASNDKVLVFSRIESESIGDIDLEELAYTEEELEEQEKEAWDERIEDKLFWQSVGLTEEDPNASASNDLEDLQSQSIITLSEQERERVLEYRDSTYFSRKRMLAPVIAMLQEQARYGHPLQLVEVNGEVKVPGLYPLPQNGGLKALIKAAGGLTEASYAQSSEITRTMVGEDGATRIEHIKFSPQTVISAQTDDITLHSKDRVNVFSVPSWQQELSVEVVGEVQFPGKYAIRRGESLAELLERVGGLTEFGDPNAAIFTREKLKEQERRNLRDLAEELRKQIASESLRRSSGAGAIVSYDEAKKLLRDLTQTEAIGRLVIDFEALLTGNESADVLLEDGDTLYIPSKTQSVNVIGEVYVPTSHLYTNDLTYQDYIEKSGGYRALADEDRTYIIRANGSVVLPQRNGGFWFDGDAADSLIRPGDTIVVPFDSDNVDNMTLWANASQIAYQIAVAVAAIGSL